jgi:hypothetical protein
MELATCRYIDFPSIGVIDLEATHLPEKVLDVETKRMFAEPSIMEMIASVSKALHEHKLAGGFALPAASEAVPEGSAAGTESSADAPTPPPTSERREAPLPQPAEAAKTTIVVAATGAADVVVGVAGSSPSRPVAAGDDEVRVPYDPTAAVQEQIAPEDTTRAASSEIQEVEEAGAAALMARQVVRSSPSSSPAPRGRLLPSPATTPRTTRRLRRATP